MYIYVQITHTHIYYIMHMYEILCIIIDLESPRSLDLTVGLKKRSFWKVGWFMLPHLTRYIIYRYIIYRYIICIDISYIYIDMSLYDIKYIYICI